MPEDERKRRKSASDKRYREQKGEELLQKKREYGRGRGLELKKEWQQKKMNDPHFRIAKNLRSRIYVALKRGVKSHSTMTLLGCSIAEFKAYIESKFADG